jgi:hypothetical protein
MLIIIGLIAVSVASWGIYNFVFCGDRVKAEIYYNSDLVKTVDLSAGRT